MQCAYPRVLHLHGCRTIGVLSLLLVVFLFKVVLQRADPGVQSSRRLQSISGQESRYVDGFQKSCVIRCPDLIQEDRQIGADFAASPDMLVKGQRPI